MEEVDLSRARSQLGVQVGNAGDGVGGVHLSGAIGSLLWVMGSLAGAADLMPPAPTGGPFCNGSNLVLVAGFGGMGSLFSRESAEEESQLWFDRRPSCVF